MGTTPKPLVIAISPTMAWWPEVEALKAQKHTILVLTTGQAIDWGKVDVVLGEKCRLMNLHLRKYLQVALDEARKERYGADGKVIHGREVGPLK